MGDKRDSRLVVSKSNISFNVVPITTVRRWWKWIVGHWRKSKTHFAHSTQYYRCFNTTLAPYRRVSPTEVDPMLRVRSKRNDRQLTCWPNPGLSSSIGWFSNPDLFEGNRSFCIRSKSFVLTLVRAARWTSRRALWTLCMSGFARSVSGSSFEERIVERWSNIIWHNLSSLGHTSFFLLYPFHFASSEIFKVVLLKVLVVEIILDPSLWVKDFSSGTVGKKVAK